jgi:hypothetical protein
MKQTTLAIVFMALVATAAAKNKETTFRYNGYGYTYFSAGGCSHGYANIGGGGGGEGFLWRGLTLGLDIGYFNFPADRNNGYGVMTLNVGWHFVDRSKPVKLDPYLGLTVLGAAFTPGGFDPAGHLTGGFDYWFKNRMGLRVGGVFQVVGEEPIMSVQVGLTFR